MDDKKKKIEQIDTDSREIKQHNFDPKKFDEEEGVIGDLAVNPFAEVTATNEKLPKNNPIPPINNTAPSEEQWRTTCKIEFDQKLQDNNPPRLEMKPFHIFGYRERDGHNNIKYIDNESILYSAGKIGIIQNLTTNEQKYFIKHNKEISSLCVNNEKTLIATGEESNINYDIYDNGDTSVRIWDSSSFAEKCEITIPYFGVKSLSFSLDSKYLICCCLDEKHKVVLIDVDKNKVLFDEDGDEKKILSIAFKSNNEFATAGINNYKFWTISDDKLIFKNYVNTIDSFDIRLGIIVAMNEFFITGSSLGMISLWKDNINMKTKKAHNSQVDSLYCDNKIIISGGRDKTLALLDKDLSILKKITLDLNPNQIINSSPKSLDVSPFEEGGKNIKKILMGTLSGDIIELIFNKTIIEENKPEIKIYNSSHYSNNNNDKNEITSISFWKKLKIFVTTCEDKTIRFWDLDNKKQSTFILIDEDMKPTASAFSNQGDFFVVGFNNGNIRLYSTSPSIQTKKDIKEKDRTNPITVMKYSKDDDLLACATKDEKGNNIIDVYFASSFNKYCTFIGAQNQIDGLDWTEKGDFIVSFSHEKECRIFSINYKMMITDYNNEKYDIGYQEWNTFTICYGWLLKGYYDSKDGDVPIYACERFKIDQNGNYVIAIGDYNGNAKIYKFPIIDKNQKSIGNAINHGRKVTHVKFGKVGMKDILMTSGSDGCLITWKIEEIL